MGDIRQYVQVPQFSSPVWLSDGEIAFLHGRGGVRQVYKSTLALGDMHRLTQNSEAVWMLAGDPDTGDIFFTLDEGGDENQQIYQLGRDGGAPVNLTSSPGVCFHFGGRRKGTGKLIYACNRDRADVFDIAESDMATGRERVVYRGEQSLNTPAGLSPDGRYLLFNILLGHFDHALWLLDLDSGGARPISDDGEPAAETRPVWTPQGEGFYFISNRDSDRDYVARWDRDTSGYTRCFQSPWDVTHIALSADGRYLAIVLNEDGFSTLRVMDTETGAVDVALPPMPEGVIPNTEAIRWSPEGYRLLFTVDSSIRPSAIWLLDVEGQTCQCLTDGVADGVPAGLVKPELRTFTSFDGLEIPYWLYIPRGREGKQLPLVIDIHGGPEDQTRPVYCDYIQYYLSLGIGVAAPNVRGSTGYGKAYCQLDDVDRRMDSVQDIGALASHLTASGSADRARLGVTGISYGGYMTLSAISVFPAYWTCAVEFVGIYNLISFLENTSGYRRTWREAEYGSLARDRELLWSCSPASRIEAVTTPLMVVHGANDPRVPVSETEQMVQALRDRGNEVDYLKYMDEGHGLLKCKNRIDCYGKTGEFLTRHLLG